MRIFYFHGWGGRFDEAKHKILSKFGDEVYYPDIDYQNQRNLINAYDNEIYGGLNKGVPTLVVGTSLGGYMGFHISNICRCPALLFNPAFFFKSGAEMRPSGGSMGSDDRNKQFIFSVKDEEIDIKRCVKFLREYKYDDSLIKLYDNLTHQIPLDIFENEFTEFREKYKDFANPNIEKKSKPSSSGYIKAKKNRYEPIPLRELVGEQPDEPQRVNEPIYYDDPNDDRWWDHGPARAEAQQTQHGMDEEIPATIRL
jgi:hypothetical protein